MFTKPGRWVFVFAVSLLSALAVIFCLPVQSSAAQTATVSNNTCLTCHEDLYLLHDTGKLYCITAHADRCSGCHDGNPTTMKKEESHLGLLLHPQENNGAKCLECHKRDELPTRISKYKADGGFEEVITPEIYIPCSKDQADLSEISQANPVILNWKWPVGATVLFGLWLALVFLSPLKP